MFQNPTGDLRASLSYGIFRVRWEVGARRQVRSACIGRGMPVSHSCLLGSKSQGGQGIQSSELLITEVHGGVGGWTQ